MMAKGQRNYSPEEIETGLTYIAKAAGNAARASRKLAEDGHGDFPPRTLRLWAMERHASRYQEILIETETKRREETAERLDDLTQQEIDAAEETLTAYLTRLRAGDIGGKDLAASLRNIKVSLGIGNQNAYMLRGQPTKVVEYRGLNVEQVGKLLARYDVDTTAVEMRGAPLELEAEVVEE